MSGLCWSRISGRLYDRREKKEERKKKRGDFGMRDLIKKQIFDVVRGFLLGRVNTELAGTDYHVPLIKFKGSKGKTAIVSDIEILVHDTFSVTVTYTLPETPESEFYCYAYGSAFCIAVKKDPTLGGVVEQAVVSEKKYVSPNTENSRREWQAVITLQIAISKEQ
jgi:hypothetical protein